MDWMSSSSSRASALQARRWVQIQMLPKKFNSKWIKDLNIRPETETVTGKHAETLQDTSVSDDFLNKAQTAQKMTARLY
jgi:hypothetical protein